MVSELNLSKRDKVLIVVGLIVIGVLLIALLIVVRNVSRARENARELASPTSTATTQIQSQNLLSPSASSTSVRSATATATAAPSATATEDPNKDLNSAKAVVSNFMEAYVNRSLDQARPYMTDAFYNSYSQADFAGVSSPSRDRFDIISAEVKQSGAVYGVKAYLYLKLNGADSGTNVLQLDVVKDGTKFLVS